MSKQNDKIGDDEVLDMLATAQKSYEQYLALRDSSSENVAMPTYSMTNPIGLVVDAIVE